MKKSTEIILLVSVIAFVVLAIYFGMPGSTESVSTGTYPTPAPTAPVVMIIDTTDGFTSYGAPVFYGTVQSNTAVPVTAEIAADIYDASGRTQLAHGDTEVGITPYRTVSVRGHYL